MLKHQVNKTQLSEYIFNTSVSNVHCAAHVHVYIFACICSSSLLNIESFSFLALYPKFKVLPFRLERYRGNNALMTLLSELGMIAYTIYFFVKEIKLMKKQKKEYFKVQMC